MRLRNNGTRRLVALTVPMLAALAACGHTSTPHAGATSPAPVTAAAIRTVEPSDISTSSPVPAATRLTAATAETDPTASPSSREDRPAAIETGDPAGSTNPAPLSSSPTVSATSPPKPLYTTSAADNCVAAGGPMGSVGNGYPGTEYDTDACQFHATTNGGFQAIGPFGLWIDRGDQHLYFEGPECQTTGFIQPGDVVTIQSRGQHIAAGQPYHC